ncbi:MAG: glycosyltransferase family 9 protein [Bacteroidetes bacterium]|nr:glycosyltransferase family 9 protein [Bacteroidota bacterium]
MIDTQTVISINELTTDELSFKQVAYMAYTGQYELVHSILRRLPVERRDKFSDKDILSQAIWGSIERIRTLRSVHNDELIKYEKQFLIEILEQFISYCNLTNIYPKEIFQSILYVSEELIHLASLNEAIKYLQLAFDLGINKFPNLRVDAINKITKIYSKQGRIKDSTNQLIHLIEHPYFITDRNQVPDILFRLSRAVLKAGEVAQYKMMLFLGLRYFYTNTETRRDFVDQLRLTHKSSFKLLFSRKVKIIDKLLYLIHLFYYKLPNFHKINFGIINKAATRFLLGIVYIINYIKKSEPVRLHKNHIGNFRPVLADVNNLDILSEEKKTNERGTRILITRAMGGIGDLLMMTPGLHALKNKFPNKEIHLAIPRRYFQIFQNNPDVKLIDIEEDFFSHFLYTRWFNFTDCPASRKESRSAPNVKKSRIDIFAQAMGVKGIRLFTMDRSPRYFISQDEHKFADDFFVGAKLNGETVIGIQLHSEETYRDYPKMENLVEVLSKKFKVLLFDSYRIDGYNFENVFKIDSFSLREAFAIAHKCDGIIAPDSSFVHFAAAFKIPTIALFGPIDGEVRTKSYSNCKFIDSQDQLGCLPCWRNENIPCKLTGMRNSACMESIPVNRIVFELEMLLKRCGK